MKEQALQKPNIVLRTGINVFKRFLKKQESKVSSNCIKHINSSNYTEFIKVFAVRPMFSRYYLIYADIKEEDKRYYEYLYSLSLCPWVQLILVVNTRNVFEELKCSKNFSEFLFLDCYNLKAEVIRAYIRSELLSNGAPKELVTEDIVKYIQRRARYKEYVLDSVLPILAQTDLQRKTVASYIAPYTGVTLQNIGCKIFDPDKKKPVGEFLYQYRNYIDPIFRSVRDYLKTWFDMYEEYAQGHLSEDNILEWVETSGKKYNIRYDYQAKSWLDSFSRYSYDFMLVVFTMVQDAYHTNNNTQFITIYKIFKAVNA